MTNDDHRELLNSLDNDKLATVLQTMAEFGDHRYAYVRRSYHLRLSLALTELGYLPSDSEISDLLRSGETGRGESTLVSLVETNSPNAPGEPQYSEDEYLLLRRMALSLIELRTLGGERAQNLDEMLEDLRGFVEEGIEEGPAPE